VTPIVRLWEIAFDPAGREAWWFAGTTDGRKFVVEARIAESFLASHKRIDTESGLGY
jgi:hypothetical protein